MVSGFHQVPHTCCIETQHHESIVNYNHMEISNLCLLRYPILTDAKLDEVELLLNFAKVFLLCAEYVLTI